MADSGRPDRSGTALSHPDELLLLEKGDIVEGSIQEHGRPDEVMSVHLRKRSEDDLGFRLLVVP